uniref:Uncharacterized protein n=1 Tax=Alexandrium fundyense TaxID=2932 RepID=A4UHC9_ALEFU|nr:hypothetical protein [Alexandrium fundyense]
MGGDSGPAPKRPTEALAKIPWQADAAVFAGCSVLSAISVVPVVMAVDKSVTQAAAGMPLGQALKTVARDMLMRPIAMLRSAPFWMVMGVYSCTYGANNLVDVASERCDLAPTTQNSMKLLGATGAYTTSSILKDVAFAKMFSKAAASAKEVQRAVPLTTYGTFLFRDALIIGAGFILPAMVAGGIKSSTGMEPNTAEKVAQLATPCGMQIVITPIHLLGLNLYNTPTATVGERSRAVMSTYPEATGVRMFRFFWAYGVGGLVNKELNQRARDWTVERYASKRAGSS